MVSELEISGAIFHEDILPAFGNNGWPSFLQLLCWIEITLMSPREVDNLTGLENYITEKISYQ